MIPGPFFFNPSLHFKHKKNNDGPQQILIFDTTQEYIHNPYLTYIYIYVSSFSKN